MTDGLPSSTTLTALPALSLDLETTGLDVRSDRVVQAGGVVMIGTRVIAEPRLDRLVNPGIPIPAESIRIHGIGDAAVAGAPRFAEVAPALQAIMSGRAVVGHNVAFDLAVLRYEAARANVPWHDPPALDIGLLFAALEPSVADLSLEGIARRFGVMTAGRHTAIGDATMAAELLARLLVRLREIDVRTLGEAQSLAARRQDLIRRQADAGWYSSPARRDGGLLEELVHPRIDSYIFERRVDDAMSAPPMRIDADATLGEAARLMVAHRIGALVVGAAGGAPAGIVTERDVLRASARDSTDPAHLRLREIMSTPVECIGVAEPLYRALGRMDRGGFRHLCVVDDAGHAVGMLSQRDLLQHRARASLALGDEIARAEDGIALAAAYGDVTVVAERLLSEGVRAVEVARLIADEARALTARAAELAAEGMAARGRPAPAPWCLLILGSAGRGESLLSIDQDNALIYEGERADDAWFAEFGEGIAELLDEAGLPRCKGGVMAANAEWRGTPAEWRERIGGWLRRARPEDLLNVDIFFDLMPVAGDSGLARTLQIDAVAAAARSHQFVALLAESVSVMAPSIGPFGGLRTEAGRIDLKRGALLPLVGIARTLALRIGSLERSTPARLHAAAAAGRMPEADAAILIDAHSDLLDLVLRQQIADLASGVRPSARVATQPLGRSRARRLARELRRLEQMLGVLRGEVAG